METFSHKKVKARKSHVCSTCNRTIEKGDMYTTSFVVDDKESWVWKECELCEKFMARYDIGYYGEGYTSDDIYDALVDICCNEGYFRDNTLTSHSPAWVMMERLMGVEG